MGLSKQMLSYPDIQTHMDQALESTKGITITFDDERLTKRYMARANFFRKLTREKNKLLYPDPGHPMHHESIYDSLILRMSKDKLTITMEKVLSTAVKVEELK